MVEPDGVCLVRMPVPVVMTDEIRHKCQFVDFFVQITVRSMGKDQVCTEVSDSTYFVDVFVCCIETVHAVILMVCVSEYIFKPVEPRHQVWDPDDIRLQLVILRFIDWCHGKFLVSTIKSSRSHVLLLNR